MYYVYVLLSEKDNKFYVGYTDDIQQRIASHKNGQVRSTKPRLPLRLIFCECFLNKNDALRREGYLKTTKGKTTLRSMLKEYLNDS